MKPICLLFFLAASISVANAQDDYPQYDLSYFELNGNVKNLEIQYHDPNDNLVFDNNYSHFNKLTFNKAGKITETLKMTSPNEVVERKVYKYNNQNHLVEELEYKPLEEYLIKYNGLDYVKKFNLSEKGLIIYQIKLSGDYKSVKDSINYFYDKKNNLIKVYSHNHGRYNMILNKFDKRNRLISSVHFSAHPRSAIHVFKWEYKGNEKKSYHFVYEELDIREISLRILEKSLADMDERRKGTLNFEQYLDDVLLRKYLFDFATQIKGEFMEGGNSHWSGKFVAEPEQITYYTKDDKEKKIIWTDYSVEYEYNKQGDTIIVKCSYLNDNPCDLIENNYIYDDFGNWIEKVEFTNSKLSRKIIRMITYY